MRGLTRGIAGRLDIRPNEMGALWLSFSGAFFVLGFTVLGRSIREALYLTNFDVTTLPYITVAVALLSIPTVALFSRLLSTYTARSVLEVTVFIQIVGIGLLWPVIGLSRVFVVVFYIWTMLGTMVIASGFWIVTAELFPLRSAKRLFGIISAGGTGGAMVFGTSMSWLTLLVPVSSLLLLLIAVLVAFVCVQRMLPGSTNAPTGAGEPSSPRDALRTLLSDPHLRLIASIVCIATLTTTILDYQFKDFVRASIESEEGLACYLGRFYGFTGAAALAIQLVIGAPLLRSFGIGWALSVLPLFALFGSAAFFVGPSLFAITCVRGADLSVRRSIHRSVIEVGYLPVPADLRNKTKSFIDSVVDSLSEGLGALLIFLWVTLGGLSSVRLSFFVIGLSGIFLIFNTRMKRQYLRSVAARIGEGEAVIVDQLPQGGGIGRDLLSMSMTRLDITRMGLRTADSDLVEAADAFLQALEAKRFEDRYRACIGLMNLVRKNVAPSEPHWQERIWRAVLQEVGIGRAVWEVQQILDSTVDDESEFVRENVNVRGQLSLEHTFRLLALVLDHEAVRNAFHGVLVGDENFRSFSLEYLEQVLPADVKEKLWPFIGDLSDEQRERSARDLDEVVTDLAKTAHTLFASREELDELKRALDGKREGHEPANG
jgi:ATP/ADP translocase